MKIACSSASFGRALRAGTLTHLEWLDVCANELEIDGVVCDVRDLPRTDEQYLAEVKKLAVDLGLTIAAVAADSAFANEAAPVLGIAAALGAPLVIARAPETRDDPAAWETFAAAVKSATRAAKRLNVTLAARNAPATLCASVEDCKQLAKDVDSAWLRYALSSADFGVTDDTDSLLAKTVIATHAIADLATFAGDDDSEAQGLVSALARFRGFVVLETLDTDTRTDYHAAIERFAAKRERTLLTSARS